MAVTGSTHNMGFTLTQTFPNQSGGIQPTFILEPGDAGLDRPAIHQSFRLQRRECESWWQGQETTRPPEFNNFNFSIQRQLSSSMLVEASYNGVMGSHLQAQLLDYNQDNPALLTAFGNDRPEHGCTE